MFPEDTIGRAPQICWTANHVLHGDVVHRPWLLKVHCGTLKTGN